MKKLILYTLIIVTTFLFSGCKKNQALDVVSSRDIVDDNRKITTLYIVADMNKFRDYTIYSKNIISHCLKNDFDNIKFSYDVEGYPSEIVSYVYSSQLNYETNHPVFKMIYTIKNNTYSSYNIKDNTNDYTYEIISY